MFVPAQRIVGFSSPFLFAHATRRCARRRQRAAPHLQASCCSCRPPSRPLPSAQAGLPPRQTAVPGLANSIARQRAAAGGYFLVACVARRGPGALCGSGRPPAGRQRRPPRRATKTRIALRQPRPRLPKEPRERSFVPDQRDLAWHTSYPSSPRALGTDSHR